LGTAAQRNTPALEVRKRRGTNAEGAFAHKKPLLLAEVPVERTPVAKPTCMDLRLQEVSVCLEDYCAQIVHGTLENVTDSNRL
jgi:hypothetical protein